MKYILHLLGWVALCAALAGCESRTPTPNPTPSTGSELNVVINEVNTSAKYIELYNKGDKPADISGLTIIKNNEGPISNIDGSADFVVADGNTLPAGGFAVIGCKGNTTQYEGLSLGTSKSGISGSKSLLLELVDSKGNHLDYFVNTAKEKPTAKDEWDGAILYSFDVAMRVGDGEDKWFIMAEGTPGTTNGGSVIRGHNMPKVDFEAEPTPDQGGNDDNQGSTPSTPSNPGTGTSSLAESVAYVWDESTFPEIRLTVKEDEWNKMLKTFDQNNKTKQYFKGDVSFFNGTKTFEFNEAGWRLRGNTSRRRPEGNGGEVHKRDNADWHHVHLQFNFRKYHKDSAHTIGGVRKVHVKWAKDDPSYVREMYCYDLFRRYGVWTAINDIYCRLWIHVEGDKQPAYYGVYEMLETIDDEYLEVRSDLFGGHKGNLWKCSYTEKGPADLKEYSNDAKFGLDQDTDEEWPYELKTEHNSFSSAKAQLVDFMQKLNSKSGQDLHDWLGEVIDIPLFLKTYAVNVTVGMWDDYWNNGNNYYMYFNASGTSGYKFYFIPYDYDNTLGTSQNVCRIEDSGTCTPLKWGSNSMYPLVNKIIQFEDYKALYVGYLKELVDSSNSYFDQHASAARIRAWHSKISPYVSNDTGEDMEIKDRPASWSNKGHYRLLEDSNNNFFKVKKDTYNSILN